jgi:hypothetical protein
MARELGPPTGQGLMAAGITRRSVVKGLGIALSGALIDRQVQADPSAWLMLASGRDRDIDRGDRDHRASRPARWTASLATTGCHGQGIGRD